MPLSNLVAIHVDGGALVGLGHATRCIGLSEACKQLGLATIFLIDPASGLEDFLTRQGQVVRLWDSTSLSLAQCAGELGAAALIIDSYRFDGEALQMLQKQGLPIVCFDDQANRALPVDLVINGSPAAFSLTYDVRPNTQLLLGVAYQVVRPEFLAEVPRDYEAPVRSLFVSMGGSDVLGIFDPLLEFLNQHTNELLADVQINFVVGHFARVSDRSLPSNIYLHHSPGDMRSLMVTADLAISAGGQTLYELARCGVPTIAFGVGQDQIHNLMSLAQRGCIVNIGWANQLDWLTQMQQVLARLIQSPGQRQAIGRSGSQLIDGKGALRIATVIQSLIQTQP